ncbi:MAG: aldo/keto reductase [Verrucomicrobia bacterium]|nr:aldo/keto reductase [Verrucomicrobiota bacterium]
MHYTSLGRTAVKVSRLCLGTMNSGWVTNEDNSLGTMGRALGLGIYFWDTANIYGKGASETLMGRFVGF